TLWVLWRGGDSFDRRLLLRASNLWMHRLVPDRVRRSNVDHRQCRAFCTGVCGCICSDECTEALPQASFGVSTCDSGNLWRTLRRPLQLGDQDVLAFLRTLLV